jgi:hypothetical protein
MEGLRDTTKSLNKYVTSPGGESNSEPPVYVPIRGLICSFRASEATNRVIHSERRNQRLLTVVVRPDLFP